MAVPITKAILLATSETNKLYPLTQSMPTPMIPVVNRPIMAYMVELLARQGFKDIIVSLHNLAGQIEAYFGNGRRWGVSLEYALQSQPLGTAGSLKWGQSLLSETFIVLPGDRLFDIDISAALAYHQSQQCAATIIECRYSPQNHLDHLDKPFNEPLTQPDSMITGAYIFDARVLDLIPTRTRFDIHSQLLPAITNNGLPISCFEMTGYGNTLQSFEDYSDAQSKILDSQMNDKGHSSNEPGLNYFSVNGRQFGKGIWIGRNQVIHPNARLTPPVYIGDSTYIGGGVELGPYTVIGSNVIIDDEATISQSTILDGTYVGQLVKVDQRLVNNNLIIDLQTADFMHVTDDFLIGQTYQPDLNRGFKRALDIIIFSPIFLLAFFLSVPLALLLRLTTGKAFRTVERQYFKPMPTQANQLVTFRLFQFNAEDDRGGYNWIGSVLTRLEIHRWPELWNLLKGDLALIGVKPMSPEEIGRLNEQWHQARHEQRPGLTGLWYINTWRNSDLDDYVVADIYYMATQNWREDLRILLKTPVSWFKRIRNK